MRFPLSPPPALMSSPSIPLSSVHAITLVHLTNANVILDEAERSEESKAFHIVDEQRP